MEMPRVPPSASSAPTSATAPTRPELAPVAVRPVDAMARTTSGIDTVQIALFAGRGVAGVLRDARRLLGDPQPERRREGIALLRAIAGHPVAKQALPELRAAWERGTPIERAEAELCLRAITGRGPEQWGAAADEDGVSFPAAHPARRGSPGPGAGEATAARSETASYLPLQAQQHWLARLLHDALPTAPTLIGGALLAAAILAFLVFR